MTGLAEALALAAAWIAGGYSPPDESDYAAFFADAPAPVLRRTFSLAEAPRSAVWRIAAAGLCDASVNGVRVTPTAIAPWTEFDRRVISRRYDVAGLLRAGENVLELRVGNGWYNLLPMKMWGVYNFREGAPQGVPCVCAELEIAEAGGGRVVIPTDGSWKAADGPVLRNSLYLGERYDSRVRLRGWTAARVVDGPKGAVEDDDRLPDTVVYRRWKAKSVSEPRPGVFVVDFGEVFAGNAKMTLRGVPSGGEVSLRYGELLNQDGTVNGLTAVAGQMKNPEIDPPGIAYQSDSFIGDGSACNDYEPRFTFHCFRYAEVTGPLSRPAPGDFEACAYSADLRESCGFVCSNEKLNRVREMCRRTFRANLLEGVQSDCPGRERYGYGGDLSVSAEAVILNYDMSGFYRKFLRDRIHSAELNGGVPTVFSPALSAARFPAGKIHLDFAADIPVVADLLLRYYDDMETVAVAYACMARYLDLCEKAFEPNDVPPSNGDHEAITKADRKTASLCHYHEQFVFAAKFARLLGRGAEAARWEASAKRLEEIFAERGRYVPVKGYVDYGHQSEQCYALYHGMLPEDVRPAAYKILRDDVIAHDCALSTGIFGTQYLLELLSAHGDAELAGRVAAHEGFPGWFNMLDHGATTLWETWIGSDNLYSHCHPMFGSVAAWMVRWILGIRVAPDAIGCDKVEIDPHAAAGVTSASGWLDTPKGRIEVSWRLVDGHMKVVKTLPAGISEVSADRPKSL